MATIFPDNPILTSIAATGGLRSTGTKWGKGTTPLKLPEQGTLTDKDFLLGPRGHPMRLPEVMRRTLPQIEKDTVGPGLRN